MKIGTKIALAVLGTASAVIAGLAGKEIHRILNGEIHLPEGFTYTAHSGCEGTPDNSMEFLQKAVALGVPVLEVDVTVRNDGTPVLLHAETAGSDEGLLFSDAVRYLSENSDTVRVNLDLKSVSGLEEVVRILKKYKMQDRCFFTGVESNNSQTVKIDAPGIPYYLNAELNIMRLEDEGYLRSIASEVHRSGAIGLNCNYKYASKKLVEVFHEEGLLVSFWTADNKIVMRNLLTMSSDNITTRNPILLASLLAQ